MQNTAQGKPDVWFRLPGLVQWEYAPLACGHQVLGDQRLRGYLRFAVCVLFGAASEECALVKVLKY
jgi:hypothetical protein